LQNFFHFDSEQQIDKWKGIDVLRKFPYKMNAILPSDIVIKKLIVVKDDAHCRFDAICREYKYYIYQSKNPFLDETGYYFPYKLDMEVMHEAASLIKEYTDFTSFSKRNTQVKNFKCGILLSEWTTEDDCIVYHVKANRFLRGMVRALVATMLKLGRNKLDIEGFRNIIQSQDCSKASFAVPGKGLFLVKVSYPYL
jgi:tRNA pseudouridine38-40 synthase